MALGHCRTEPTTFKTKFASLRIVNDFECKKISGLVKFDLNNIICCYVLDRKEAGAAIGSFPNSKSVAFMR